MPTQVMPQPPQFVRLEDVSASQPFPTLPSQSSKAPEHVKSHPEGPQRATALAGAEHEFPQLRQLVVVPSVVSHPAPPLQFANPESQVMPQLPEEQVAVPFTFEQALPQVPQVVVLERSASQPFVGLPSQSWKPLEQFQSQTPAPEQEAVEWEGAEQATGAAH
jgi:hypothetical protein